MVSGTHYEGAGWTLEEAIIEAHKKVPNRKEGHLDLGMSRLVNVTIQRIGISQSVSFQAVVEEDLASEPWREPPRLIGI